MRMGSAMISNYSEITGADTQRYNEIVQAITDGVTISAEDAEFYGAYNTAVAAIDVELSAKLDAISTEAQARVAALQESEKTARDGYNKLVDAALSRYERVRYGNE